MADYKDVLREKAGKLRAILARYGDKINDDKMTYLKNLVNNTFEITNGRLDALDYSVREEGIRNYHHKLDEAITELLAIFEPKGLENYQSFEENRSDNGR